MGSSMGNVYERVLPDGREVVVPAMSVGNMSGGGRIYGGSIRVQAHLPRPLQRGGGGGQIVRPRAGRARTTPQKPSCPFQPESNYSVVRLRGPLAATNFALSDYSEEMQAYCEDEAGKV
eukprot:1189883-Prorocentrum_minimum.AAC.2